MEEVNFYCNLGGHLTINGGICLKMLTIAADGGWNNRYNIEDVIREVNLAMASHDPNPAVLDTAHWNQPYSEQYAREDYLRYTQNHKWGVSKSFGKSA